MDTDNSTKDISKDYKKDSENSSECEFVFLFKDQFDRQLFPHDFNTWSMKEQCTWINENMAKFFPNLPHNLLNFIPAAFCELEPSPKKLPEWLDINKYHRGQQFVHKHYFAMVIAKLVGLIYICSFDDAMKPAILGGYRHDPYLAFKKFMVIIRRILSWYDGEPWVKGTKAYNDMQITHKMHLAIRAKLIQLTNKEIDTKSKVASTWCPDHEILLKDFAAACPFEKSQLPHFMISEMPYRPKGMNNADISAAQSCVLLFMLCPQNIGMHDATDEDLEAFCHMWRCYGYFLGLKDEYNFCRGNLEEIKQRLKNFYEYWVMSNFKDVSCQWEHLTRCLIEPINYYPLMYLPFKVMLLIGTDALNLDMPHLYATLNYTEWITYKIYKFILCYTLKFSSIRTVLNKLIRNILDKASKFTPEKLAKIQEEMKKQLPDIIEL